MLRLLRIMRVDLKNLQTGSRRDGAHHDAQQRARAVHAGSIRLARGRNDHFAALLVDPLNDGNFLRAA